MGAESTGSYGEHLSAWLANKGIKMVGGNSKHVHRYKEIIDNSPLKSDKKDPVVGTRIVQQGAYYNPLPSKGLSGECTYSYQGVCDLQKVRIKNRIKVICQYG